MGAGRMSLSGLRVGESVGVVRGGVAAVLPCPAGGRSEYISIEVIDDPQNMLSLTNPPGPSSTCPNYTRRRNYKRSDRV